MPVLSAAAPALEPVPWLAVAPFVLLLLSIAVLPLVAHHWWERNRNRGLVSAVLGVPVAAWLLLGPAGGAGWLADAGLEDTGSLCANSRRPMPAAIFSRSINRSAAQGGKSARIRAVLGPRLANRFDSRLVEREKIASAS